jgi:hypothetical protein
VIGWLKKFWTSSKWVAWVVIAVAVVVVLWLARTLFTRNPYAPTKLPEVPDALKKKVQKAEEDALIARVKANAEADAAKKILDTAAEIDDGEERRKRLAEALRNL